MQTVAEIAGVSAMTVSRALKSEAPISKETRERVLAAVNRIGYVPDLSARVFASRRSGFVAALVPSLNNSNFAETVRGMSEVFDRGRPSNVTRRHRILHCRAKNRSYRRFFNGVRKRSF